MEDKTIRTFFSWPVAIFSAIVSVDCFLATFFIPNTPIPPGMGGLCFIYLLGSMCYAMAGIGLLLAMQIKLWEEELKASRLKNGTYEI